MLSVHTSPLDQPGTGDAGGLNVYMVELAKRLAERNVEVEIFTRATSSHMQPTVEAAPGVAVRHVLAGPYELLDKFELSSQLCAFTSGVLRVEACYPPGRYAVVHSHYWLSGQVGWLATERWHVPLVHTMHTMAKVKNRALADGDDPEPIGRVIGEEQVVRAADRLIANTDEEAGQLISLYDADPAKVETVHPGVDLDLFRPVANRDAVRARLGLRPDDHVVLFAGRVQPLKAPDVLIRAAAELVDGDPAQRSRLVPVVVGGLSGNGLAHPDLLAGLAKARGVDDIVRFEPPVDQAALADWYRAADLTVVPSHNESFGLVALESQACGTPVVAAAVGGLRTAVVDGRTGVLVNGHDPRAWANVLGDLLDRPAWRADLAHNAVTHAREFSWDATADRMLDVYGAANARNRAELLGRTVIV
jgi:D-inositol-3-phosphate glycosyltransferase